MQSWGFIEVVGYIFCLAIDIDVFVHSLQFIRNDNNTVLATTQNLGNNNRYTVHTLHNARQIRSGFSFRLSFMPSAYPRRRRM